MDPVTLQNFLEQTNPEDVQYELISGNGSILINNVTYYCSKTALNISYTYHAYNLCAENESDEFVILLADILVLGFIPSTNSFVWNKHCHRFLTDKNTEIEQNIRSMATADPTSHNFLYVINENTTKKFSVVSGTQSHLGHYLWNHLGAMWRMFRRLNNANLTLPLIISKNSELFGNITDLFPQAELDIISADYNPHSIQYCNCACIEPYGLGPVSQGLRNAILKANNMSILNDEHSFADNSLVICVAFRTGVRQCVNKQEVLEELAEQAYAIKNKFNLSLKLIIYHSVGLAGGNTSPTKPLDDLISSLKIDLSSCNEVFSEIIHINNMPLHEALRYLNYSSLYIAEWGASLSLFSWILGKPGIWLTPDEIRSQTNARAALTIGSGIDQNMNCVGDYYSEIVQPSLIIPDTENILANNDQSFKWHSAAIDYKVNCKSLGNALHYFLHRLL